ncbi:MAG TPA: DUF2752 domain-containing protein [Pirellulales bacterium]|nr:DUF2752 domain-containing protein [Pirellulales bacterium]
MNDQPISAAAVHSDRGMFRNHHWVMLAVAVAVVVAATVLEVQPEERVALRGLSRYPLPHLCMSRSLLGLSCPGCGLTRSFVYLAHGRWQEAWRVHRLGWLLAGLVLIQLPYRGMILARLMRPISSRAAQWLAWGLVGLMAANWLPTLPCQTNRLIRMADQSQAVHRAD